MNAISRLGKNSRQNTDLLHLCVGCSDEELARLTVRDRQVVQTTIGAVAALVPTLFVVRHDQTLTASLEPENAVMVNRGSRLVTAETATLDAFARLEPGSMVLVSGIHASSEVFAAAADLMDFKGCHVVLVREAIGDTSDYGMQAAFNMLVQAYPGQIEIIGVDEIARDSDAVFSHKMMALAAE